MKKGILSLMLVMVTLVAMSQTVAREMVVVEVGTGTWCTYCPGAAMGVDDLLANGKKVAVVENHNGDTYANVYSNARNSYYGISGYPTATFDGNQAVVGGNHSSSMYNSYLPKYNSAIAVGSPVEMTMDITNTGLDYTATITLTKVGPISGTALKLHFAVTQSHIMQNWQGQTHLEHVNRLMVPSQSGTDITFASGDVQVVVLNFTMQSAWPLEDCEFVVWMQNNDAGQGNCPGTTVKKWTTFQGIKRGVIDLTPGFTVVSNNVATGTPVTFTNTTFGGYIGVPEIYEWIFEGGSPASSTEKDPVVTYNTCGTYDVTLIVNRGHQIDTLYMPDYMTAGPVVVVSASPDDSTCWYTPITLDATTPNATAYLWAPGGQTTPTIEVTYLEYGLGQHDFTVTVTANGCDVVKEISAYLDACTGVAENRNDLTIAVYPNPSDGHFTLELKGQGTQRADLTIVNSLGVTVYAAKDLRIDGSLTRPVDLSSLAPGLYSLVLQNSSSKTVQKIMIR